MSIWIRVRITIQKVASDRIRNYMYSKNFDRNSEQLQRKKPQHRKNPQNREGGGTSFLFLNRNADPDWIRIQGKAKKNPQKYKKVDKFFEVMDVLF
jgi:hypothetical protein